MNERIEPRRVSGNSIQVLRNWALLFLAAGIVGQSIIQNRILNIMELNGEQLLEVMNSSKTNLALATSAIILQVVMYCALPLFLFMLIEGVTHTSSLRNYLLRVAGMALVSEIPYDLAMNGRAFDWADQNPVFGLLLGMVMIYFFKVYCKGKLKSILITFFVVLVSILWIDMLRIADGLVIVIMTTVLWFTRKSRKVQLYVGALVMCFCVVLPSGDVGTLGSLRYLAAPMSFLLIFRYNEEPGESGYIFNYAAYPVLLLCVWIAGMVLF